MNEEGRISPLFLLLSSKIRLYRVNANAILRFLHSLRMRHTVPLLVLIGISAAFTACSEGNPAPQDEAAGGESSVGSSDSREGIRETKNVSYTGTVQPAGMSIYMEGTHRLTLADGRFLLLESSSVDLNGYVNEEVRVLGAIRPTVETDAMIMRVESIALLAEPEEEAPSSEPAENEVSSARAESSTFSSSAAAEEEDLPPPSSQKSPSSESSIAASPSTPAFIERISAMSSQEFGPENWTQQYCTAHIGFCIPVHRNWWFKSFGATTTHYWHVEISSGPLENLGEGPLVVDLNGESLTALSIEDGALREEGNLIAGYRTWTNGRHFRIHADKSLRPAVEYITKSLKATE